MNDQEAVAKI